MPTVQELRKSFSEGQDLSFASDDEKNQVLVTMQDEGVSEEDLPLIQKIRDAEVSGNAEQQEPGEETPEPTSTPEDVNAAFAGLNIPDETYHDDGGQEKPFFTFKNVQSAIDSIVPAQKHIQYLTKKRIPQVQAEAYEKAKSEYEKTVKELQDKLENAQKATPAQKPPEAPQQSGADLNAAISGLKDLGDPSRDDYDFQKHIRALQDVVTAQSQEIQKGHQTFQQKFSSFEEQQKAAEEQKRKAEEAEQERKSQQQQWQNICEGIDSFAKEQKININQGFGDMAVEAESFHRNLAEAYYGHTPNQQEVATASAMYTSGTPAILETAKQVGLQEPKNYQQYVYLDSVDALRGGWMKDKTTGQWKQFTDNFGNRVTFPGMKEAADYYNRYTGKSDEDMAKIRKESVDSAMDKINQRDRGVIGMDASKTISGADAQAISEEEAEKFLSGLDMTEVMAKYGNGDTSLFDQMNKAREALKLSPVEINA